jgi:hypothetical protein
LPSRLRSLSLTLPFSPAFGSALADSCAAIVEP